MERNSLLCADVPLRNYSLTHLFNAIEWLASVVYALYRVPSLRFIQQMLVVRNQSTASEN